MTTNVAKAEAEIKQQRDPARWIEKLRELKVIPLKWEVALDERFERVVRTGVFLAEPESDYTVKVDVTGLRPSETYFYRFTVRDQQLSYTSYVGASGLDVAKFTADLTNPVRQLMGAAQTAWLQQQIARSSATWQVLGQQVLIGRMNIPAPILFAQISVANFAALVSKAQTAPASLTAQEQAVLQAPSVPYNLDAWDGCAAARETVFGFARDLSKNLISLAGDTHNAWGSDLADLNKVPVGVELSTSSVTSPGFETFFPAENPQVLARGLEALIGPLVYTDSSQRGYMIVTAKPDECRADWRFVDTIYSRSFTASTQKSLRVLPGAQNRKLIGV